MNALRKIGLQRRTELLVSNGKGNQSKTVIAAMIADVNQLGYTFDGDLIAVLKTQNDFELQSLHKELVSTLSEMVGANVSYNPLFKNFPHDIPEHGEYLNSRILGFLENIFDIVPEDATVLSCGHAIDHRLFNLKQFGACPICQKQVEELDNKGTIHTKLEDLTPFKLIGLTNREKTMSIFTNLIGGKGTLSEKDREDVEAFVRENGEDTIKHFMPNDIPVKENLGFIAGQILNRGWSIDIVRKYFKTATDILRFTAAICGGDVSLKEATKFKLTNGQRKLVLNLLNGVSSPEEDMLRYRERWLRLGEVTHPAKYTKRFPAAAQAFNVLRNNPENIVTFNSQVEKLVAEAKGEVVIETDGLMNVFSQKAQSLGDIQEKFEQDYPRTIKPNYEATDRLTRLLANRPGEFARRIDFLMAHTSNEKLVVSCFERGVSKMATPLLLGLGKYLQSRTEKSEFRFFVPKGNMAKIQYQEGDSRNTLDAKFVSKICRVISDELLSRFGEKDKMGHVFIDPALKTIVVPNAQRDASDALFRLQRGSRVKITEGVNTVRLFCYWKETPKSGRVDVDLSAVVYDENFNYVDHVSYTQTKSKDGASYHSGDIQSAPNGAAEFIDINMEAFKKRQGRYVGISLLSYTQQPFDDFECFAGAMERQHPGSGEAFEPKTVTQKFSVTGQGKTHQPLLLDLKTGEILWIDLSIKESSWNSVEGNESKLTQACRAANEMLNLKPNLYDLLKMHVEARGGKADSKFDKETEYNEIFGFNFAKKIDEINAEWL